MVSGKTNGMKKLLFLWFLSVFLLAVAPVTVVAQQGFPENQNPQSLEKAILDLYARKPDSALLLERLLVQLPEDKLPLQKKIDFSKSLSEKYKKLGFFKPAYYSLAIADSLKTLLSVPRTKSVPGTDNLPALFYLFVIVALAGSAWLVYLFSVTRKSANTLSNMQKEAVRLQNEIKQAEQKINDILEQQAAPVRKELETLRRREADLKAELKKTEEANYLRNTFIANLGFDVRTPLSGIIGFANMLETELALKENKELYDYAASIEKSGAQLLKLLDNVIDLSALESNRLVLKIKPVAPQKIVQKVYDQYKPEAENKSLIFKSKTDKDLNTVLADETGLEKALVQIVDNAIKYTEKGFVTLAAFYAEESDTVVIDVKDNGPGIPPEKRAYLFDTAPPEEVKEGTGIGLRLAKKYIEMMKGSLFLESVPGKGTTVTIHLPCSEEAVVEEGPGPEMPPEIEVTTAADLGDLDIFVVEDDRMNRLILEKMLKPLGKVTLTVDGDDCLNTITREAEKGHFFQVMLFDINLPGDWDGIKLLKTIREKYPEYQKVPFIAQTAYAMAGDKERLLKEGFDSYLAKPIDKNELITTIKQQLSIFGREQ